MTVCTATSSSTRAWAMCRIRPFRLSISTLSNGRLVMKIHGQLSSVVEWQPFDCMRHPLEFFVTSTTELFVGCQSSKCDFCNYIIILLLGSSTLFRLSLGSAWGAVFVDDRIRCQWSTSSVSGLGRTYECLTCERETIQVKNGLTSWCETQLLRA